MINALEKVVYPNGKTQSLAEIGGAVEGLSALIDEVDKNTSAISAINQQLGQLMEDWSKLLEREIPYDSGTSPNFSADLIPESGSLSDLVQGKEILIETYLYDVNQSKDRVFTIFTDRFDGDRLSYFMKHAAGDGCYLSGGSIYFTAGVSPRPIQYQLFDNKITVTGLFTFPVGYRILKSIIYTKDKTTPPTRTIKKKAIAKKKGETK